MKRASRNDESDDKEKDKLRRWAAHFQRTRQRRPEYTTVDRSNPEGISPSICSASWYAYESMWNGCLSGYPWTPSGHLNTAFDNHTPFNYFPRAETAVGSSRRRRITGVRINMSLDWPVVLDTVPSDFNARFDYPNDKQVTNSPTELVLFSISEMPPFIVSESPEWQHYFYEDSQIPTPDGWGPDMQRMEIFDAACSIPIGYTGTYPATTFPISYFGQPLLPKLEALGAKVIARRQFVPAQVLSTGSVTNFPTLGVSTNSVVATVPPQVSTGTIGAFNPATLNLDTYVTSVNYMCDTSTANYMEYFPLDLLQVSQTLVPDTFFQTAQWSSGLFWAIVHDRRCFAPKHDLLYPQQKFLDPKVNLHAKVYFEDLFTT